MSIEHSREILQNPDVLLANVMLEGGEAVAASDREEVFGKFILFNRSKSYSLMGYHRGWISDRKDQRALAVDLGATVKLFVALLGQAYDGICRKRQHLHRPMDI